jgi:hypothetical protein
MTSEANDAFREQMRSQFASGEQHPIARLQHHTANGEKDLALIVAEEGPEFLKAQERITFRNLVAWHFPERSKAERERRGKEEERRRKERHTAISANLKARTEEKRERRLSRSFEPVRGWNVPLDVPKS